jgi:prepilin signal peptidase PulO-like enzyme (type II secretory pathway)
MVLFALYVSTVFATLMRDTVKEQVQFGVRLFAGFVVAAIVMGWLMYPLPL